jgi:hypothetical protein
VPGNWIPNTSAPDNGTPVGVTYNVQIGNLAVAAGAAVTFVPVSGTSDAVQTLIVSGGADFVTNGNQLITNGLTTITGASSTIRVDPHTVLTTAALQLFDLDVTGGGALQMNGGIATVSSDMDVTSTGVVSGFGTLNVGDTDGVVEKAFQNSGLIQVAGTAAVPGLLTIHANGNGLGVFDTIDLDGDSDVGDINVSNANANLQADTLTLVVDGPLSDALGGGVSTSLLSIGQRDTVTFNKDFTTSANFALTMDGGNATATLNGTGAITDIQSTTITISNKAVITNNMAFTGTANTITLNAGSSLELAGTVTMLDASTLAVPSSTSELIISGSTTVTEVTGDFDWDGAGTATTTIKGTGQLTLNVNHVDMTNDLYGGTLNLDDDGDVTVNNVANVWTMGGTVHKRNAGISTVGGDAVNVSAGTITVDAAGTLSMPVTNLSAGSNVTVNGTLALGGGSVLAGPTSISGTGTLRMIGTSTVTANTTVNTAAFDWDGSGAGTLQTINDGVVFTINSSTWDADDAGDMDDPINIGGIGGTLAVNNVASWTMTRTLTTNTAVSGITSLNGNSRMIMSGALAIWNANGQTAVNVPVTFGAGSTANIAAAGFIRLNGGDAVSNFNRIEGATISGPGTLVAINTHELRGFGTINAPITFQNQSSLRADDGTLTIGGAINEVSTIGTADADGILSVTNAWNSNVAASVVLNGGELKGGAITVANANGIKGQGLVSARVVNNTRLEANVAASTLVFETAANDNDWDGAGNIGVERRHA